MATGTPSAGMTTAIQPPTASRRRAMVVALAQSWVLATATALAGDGVAIGVDSPGGTTSPTTNYSISQTALRQPDSTSQPVRDTAATRASSISTPAANSPFARPKTTVRLVGLPKASAPARTVTPNVLTAQQVSPSESRPAAPYTFAPLAVSPTEIRPPQGELPASQLSPVAAEGRQSDDTLPLLEGPARSTPRARNFCHNPLYFEDRTLEVYGHSVGVLQPAVSAVKFFASVPLIPYKMGSQPLRRVVCTTPRGQPGPGTPGNLSPADRRRGAVYQAGAALGLVFVLP